MQLKVVCKSGKKFRSTLKGQYSVSVDHVLYLTIDIAISLACFNTLVNQTMSVFTWVPVFGEALLC